MANGITWVHSKSGGYFPCSSSQELEHFKKAGFTECGDPGSRKLDDIKDQPAAMNSDKWVKEFIKDDLTRDELVKLGADKGIFIDGRWGIARIKEVLGL